MGQRTVTSRSYICPLQSEIAMSSMQNKFIAELLTKGMEGGSLQEQYKQLIQQLNNTKNTNEQKIDLLKQATKLVKESTDSTFISLVMLGMIKMSENDISIIKTFSEMPEFIEFVQKAELLTKESTQSNFLFLQYFGIFSRYLQPNSQLFQFGYTMLTQLIEAVSKGINSNESGVANNLPGQRVQQEDIAQQKLIVQLQIISKLLRNECFMIGYFTNELQDKSVINFYKGKSYINPDKIKPFIQILHTLVKDYHPTLLYQTFICVWILSFWGPLSKQLIQQGLIGLLIRALSNKQVQSNSKLVRVIMLLIGNIKNDPQAVTIMLTLNGQRLMQQLLTLSWPTDSEIESSIQQLVKLFQKTIVDTSTMQRYKMELEQTTMEMTPLHTNVPFWKANVGMMVSDNAWVLKRLVEIGQAAHERDDNDTIRVVLNDLGMFVQYHPQGRKWVEQLPEMLRFSMKCLQVNSDDVQTVALQTVSKLLLNKVV